MVTFAGAYVVVLLTLTFYVGWMSGRQRRLIEQYTRLQRQFSEAEDAESEDHAPRRKVA